ncbi:hypothetical protein KKKDEHFA_00069 [Enterococcus phage EF_TR2]|nr:hypothetical protein DDLHHHOO_00021 [Enterococcus phage EF_RCK]WVH07339.1 hypothetical protein AIMFIBHH_00049 [Enterococcus phage EF_TR1]
MLTKDFIKAVEEIGYVVNTEWPSCTFRRDS